MNNQQTKKRSIGGQIFGGIGSIIGFWFRLNFIGGFIVVTWLGWAYINCLPLPLFYSELKIETVSNTIETIKNLANIEDIRYAEDPFTKDKYNAIIKCENATYGVPMTQNDINALKATSILFPNLEPHEAKPIHISIPIIVSVVMLFLCFRRKNKT